METTSPKTGAFLGPMIALLCSFGMAAAALTFYGDRVVERTSQSRVKTAALALSGQAFDSSVLTSIAASGGDTVSFRAGLDLNRIRISTRPTI